MTTPLAKIAVGWVVISNSPTLQFMFYSATRKGTGNREQGTVRSERV